MQQSAHPALLQPLSGAPQLTDLRGLIDTVVRDAETGLRQLTNDLAGRSDSERCAFVMASRPSEVYTLDHRAVGRMC